MTNSPFNNNIIIYLQLYDLISTDNIRYEVLKQSDYSVTFNN
jgi:hypothetical protein